MNKMKKAFASVMAIMLVVSVGYFSMMSQTSAWFYDSGVIDSGDHFFFADLSVDTAFVVGYDIGFNAATKLADENEILFDETIYIDTIKVTNSGNISSKVTAQIDSETDTKGLRWFIYSEDMLPKGGSVKNMIVSKLPKLDKDSIDRYNASKYFVVAPGETKTLKIAFWVEYDDVCDKLSSGETLQYSSEITLSASHYREQA